MAHVSKSPLVTVIIPTYNWSAVLPYAINSVFVKRWTISSCWSSRWMYRQLPKRSSASVPDQRVRWINLPSNTGHQAGPNNRGLQEARGEFIAYLGHDDLWLGHHLECMIAALERVVRAWPFRFSAGYSPANGLAPLYFPNRTAVAEVRLAVPCIDEALRTVSEAGGTIANCGSRPTRPVRRAQAAGFASVFVPRLTALKFPASARKNVYRDKPSHEQARWFEKIRSRPDFEQFHLIEMMVAGEVARSMPARNLLRILTQEIIKRLAWRLRRKSGLNAMFWTAKGGGIEHAKKYKGL